jgi:hypothetical protein
MSRVITEDEAVMTAKEAATKDAISRTTVPAGQSTTTTAAGDKPTTTTTVALRVQTVTLVHTDKPGITDGEDMLVYVVRLSGDAKSGKPGATVYIDAVNDKVLEVIGG